MSALTSASTDSTQQTGERMHALLRELYPICRSITGNGLRQTLRRLQQEIPLTLHEVPSGTQVFDWTVPKEWNIRDAHIKDARGQKLVDFTQSSLHVLNYSIPVRAKLSLAELRPHLHTLPEHPDWIPYRTSYYKETWGFCLRHSQLLQMQDTEYEVVIDSTLEPGSLTYGEMVLPGTIEDEVLFSAHSCHPSLANDNLSGVVTSLFLAKALTGRRLRYSYRFLFIPGTIGAITWLARNRERAGKIKHGLVLTCVGDASGFTYKRSRRGDAAVDRSVAHLLRVSGRPHRLIDFSPYGYDERQYCSPGFNLPVGCLMRSEWGTFPEYHTSADNPQFVKPESLAESLQLCLDLVEIFEKNGYYINQSPFCEPQLGKRGLYRSTGGDHIGDENLAKLWVLNLSDGSHSLLDIAERSNLPFTLIAKSAEELCRTDLLQPAKHA